MCKISNFDLNKKLKINKIKIFKLFKDILNCVIIIDIIYLN